MPVALPSLLRPLLDLVLPVDCAGCAAEGIGLCLSCAARLAVPAAPLAAGDPRHELFGGLPSSTCARYEGSTARIVHAWKDRGRRDLAGPLALTLARAVTGLGPLDSGAPLLLVPVPSARAAVRRRGEDVVLALARRAAARLSRPGAPCRAARLLGQARATADQAALGARERAENVRGAFAARYRRDPAGICVVVDDVLTTGASAAEAVRALRAGGMSVAGVATVCATPRRIERPETGCRAGGRLD